MVFRRATDLAQDACDVAKDEQNRFRMLEAEKFSEFSSRLQLAVAVVLGALEQSGT